MKGKSLVIALLLILVGAMAIVPVMADPNVFSQTHMPFDRAWTRYSICIRLTGKVPVIPTHEITVTTFNLYTWPNATQPVPGKDYVFLYPTGADSNILYVENAPGLSNFTATSAAPSSTNQIGWGHAAAIDYVVNLNLGLGVITFSDATWTFTSGAPITGTFKGSFFGTLQNSTATGFVPAPYPGSNFRAKGLNMNNLTGVFHSANGETLLAYGSRPAGPYPFTWKCTLITP
jgi:hypothetical protein